MRRRPLLRGLILALLVGGAPVAPAQSAPDPQEAQDLEVLGALQRSIQRARDRVFPALVNVQPVIEDYAGGKKVAQTGTGSGVIVSPKGYAITNYHVAGKAKRLICTMASKEQISAHTVGADPQMDIAIIQLHLEELEGTSLHWAKLGDSSRLQVGEYVLAMGSPLALARSLTMGVVSNVERLLGEPGELEIEAGQKTGLYNLWIQTDAAINPGNSGGPLVNLRGEVVGINTRGAMFANNLGFAVPIDSVKEIMDQLIESGKVTRAFAGLKLQPVLKIEGQAPRRGVLVADVVESSPAQRAGVQAGDRITHWDGQPVDARFEEEVPAIYNRIAQTPVGRTVTIEVERGGKSVELNLVTEELEAFLGEDWEMEEWGLTVRSITDAMKREHRLQDRSGVLLTGVAGGGQASRAKPPLRTQDVIRMLDNQPVETLDDFKRITQEVIEARKERVILGVDRSGTDVLTMLKLSYEDEDKDKDKEQGEGTGAEGTGPEQEDE